MSTMDLGSLETGFTLVIGGLNMEDKRTEGRVLNEYIETLNRLNKRATTSIMPEVMKAVGDVLLETIKQILSGSPYAHFADDLTVEVIHYTSNKYRWRVNVGYNWLTLKKSVKYYIIEYGRPGRRAKYKGKLTDTLGRKIGAVQPYPHIRLAKAMALDKCFQVALDIFSERIDDEFKKLE